MIPIIATLSEWHLILALIVLFLLFGGKKLPELARGIGEAIKEFKKSQRDHVATDTPPSSTPQKDPATTIVTPTDATLDKPSQKPGAGPVAG